MKRMYITLGLILLLFVWAFSSFGQKSASEQKMIEHMRLREQMHQRLRDHLINGAGLTDDIFKDMDQMMEGADSFSSSQENYKMIWTETPSAKVLTLTPATSEQRLDISVENELITISGKRETKTAQGRSSSSFSNGFSVPPECDSSKVKISQKAGDIVVELPFKTAVKEIRKPVRPKGEVTI